MTTRTRQRLWCSACLAMLATASGCEQSEVKSQSSEPVIAMREQSLEVERVLRDDSSPTPAVVRWDDEGDARGRALYATLENTVNQPLTVTLELLTTGPHGDLASAVHGRYQLRGKSSTSVVIPLAKLPIQSAGAATAVTLVAQYELKQASVPGMPKGIRAASGMQRSYSDVRYMTFDDDRFGDAVARPSESEAKQGAAKRNARAVATTVSVRTLPEARKLAETAAVPGGDRPVLGISSGLSGLPTPTRSN
jgi:hypothetical protein